MSSPSDTLGRPLRNLRISVTDRCNLRCSYCMPEESYVWLPRPDILTFEELERLVHVFTRLGVERVRLTGGEPLLRHALPELVRRIAAVPELTDLALTTNATRLADAADTLRAAGLRRVTISLDTLRRERFLELCRRDELDTTLAGIEAACRAGFDAVKLNTVVMRGKNDDEVSELLAFGRERGIEVRFIEYMDVGGATRWDWKEVVTKDELLARIAQDFGPPTEVRSQNAREASAPADRYRLPDGTVFGLIASTSQPFCAACDRARLTADGTFYTCLYAREGLDLRAPLRAGASDEALAALLRATWEGRTDRGAEVRLEAASRGRFASRDDLRENPRLEMHTRGG